jgi:hypothetical protein
MIPPPFLSAIPSTYNIMEGRGEITAKTGGENFRYSDNRRTLRVKTVAYKKLLLLHDGIRKS